MFEDYVEGRIERREYLSGKQEMTFGKLVDTSHWIEARQLYECVLNDIKRHAREALADNDGLCEKLIQQIGNSKDNQTKSLDKEIREKKARLSGVDNLFQCRCNCFLRKTSFYVGLNYQNEGWHGNSMRRLWLQIILDNSVRCCYKRNKL